MYSGAVPKFTVHYKKHDAIGGIGHVSIEANCGDERAALSVCPDATITPVTPLKVMSFFTFPGRAINAGATPDCHTHTKYEIPENMMRDPHAALKEMKNINKSIESGKSGYSLLPGLVTSALYALMSPHVSAMKVLTAMKTGDRETLNDELKNASVTNCAKSVGDVLMAGGIECHSDIGPFYTPAGINSFFQNILPKTAPTLLSTSARLGLARPRRRS